MKNTLMNGTTCVIDGFGPITLVRPTSVADVGDLIRQAAAGQSALYPVGGQTKTGLGMHPTKPGQAIDLRGLAQVIDFPARDMTITVQSGVTMRTLREILAAEKLRLPIDVCQADHATLGGILATNSSGPRRYGYGTMRDYVIGISVLNDEGNEFKAGGRVVKNVAGYDLCKLLVGALGTLGIITQVTLKLRPLAEQQAVFGLACESTQLETLLHCLHGSRTRPVCLEVLNQAAARIVYRHASLAVPETPWIVLVGYEGNGDAVSWQVQQLVKEVGAECSLEASVDFPALPLCHALCEFAAAPDHAVTFKANLLPSTVAAFCLHADQEPQRPALRAHAGSGIVFGNWPADLTKAQAASILTTWRERARPGAVIVERCPTEWKAALNVWGPAPNDVALMHAVKAKFDPNRIFNPGRFVDGI
jgi:glycolate oxidase FAD binding subunit